MIRELKNQEKLVVDIFLKDGRSFLGKDIPPRPTGEFERYVSCFDGEAVAVFPMEQVKEFALYVEE